MNYKEEIIKLINNDENKKILSKLNSNCNLVHYIKEYTKITMCLNQYEDDKEWYEIQIGNLYHTMNDLLKRIKNENQFYKFYHKDLDEVIHFVFYMKMYLIL